MSNQTFEILCPVCRFSRPDGRVELSDLCEQPDVSSREPKPPAAGEAAPVPQPAAFVAPDLRSLTMKDYHRVVRATYSATERTATGGSRLRAYLPFVLLVVLLILGAAVIFGHMP